MAGGDQVQKGNPRPDLFLKAAKKLRVNLADCIGLVDSNTDARVAKAAGMRLVMVLNDRTDQQKQLADALILNGILTWLGC